MNAPFSTMGRPEPQIVVFTPAMRTLIADAIESLILLLDEIDGDADHEEENEHGGDIIDQPHDGDADEPDGEDERFVPVFEAG
jgi:hypothetical protein